MTRSISSETNSVTATKQIPSHLYYCEVHHRGQNSRSSAAIMSHIYRVHKVYIFFFKIYYFYYYD
jgi:hypothetical protein